MREEARPNEPGHSHNPKVAGSNPAPAIEKGPGAFFVLAGLFSSVAVVSAGYQAAHLRSGPMASQQFAGIGHKSHPSWR